MEFHDLSFNSLVGLCGLVKLTLSLLRTQEFSEAEMHIQFLTHCKWLTNHNRLSHLTNHSRVDFMKGWV